MSFTFIFDKIYFALTSCEEFTILKKGEFSAVHGAAVELQYCAVSSAPFLSIDEEQSIHSKAPPARTKSIRHNTMHKHSNCSWY